MSMPPRGGAAPPLLTAGCIVIFAIAFLFELERWPGALKAGEVPAHTDQLTPQPMTLTERSSSLIPMPAEVPSAHASSMARLPGGDVIAFWWAGSRESGPDVKVYAARWSDGSWSQPWEVASRESLGAALNFGVRRIGNPVAWTAPDGTVHLYVVATGLGGWAASRVVQLASTDEGRNFGVKRLLPMSPLFNTSVLVRNAPVALADGGWWLPVYFELGVKYPQMLSFDKHGKPGRMTRIGSRTSTLQPTIVPFSGSEVHAWMRDGDEQRVQHAHSKDGGVSWSDMPALDLPNKNTSLSALRLSNGAVVMLHNHVMPGGSDRNMLRLSVASDARTWTRLVDVVHGKAGEEFSYPDLQQVGDQLHVTYTSRRSAIAHHVFDIGTQGSL
ncbi:exo-alpha-sialidase [Pseudoduganella sp. GCM10020061]|uniref:sialidase family protein n=1 Tax=Pseudoduganella sp. GCM10020061 TaxID=3317345 RepID=UPI00362AE4C6